jgi:hypothetical protein
VLGTAAVAFPNLGGSGNGGWFNGGGSGGGGDWGWNFWGGSSGGGSSSHNPLFDVAESSKDGSKKKKKSKKKKQEEQQAAEEDDGMDITESEELPVDQLAADERAALLITSETELDDNLEVSSSASRSSTCRPVSQCVCPVLALAAHHARVPQHHARQELTAPQWGC